MVGLNAATGIVTARALAPTGRGELAAVLIWSLFLANATTLGVPSSIIYFLQRRPELRRELTMSGLMMSLLLGCLAATFGVAFLPYWLHQYSPHLVRAAQWFLLFTPLSAVMLTGRSIIEAHDRFTLSNIVQALTPATTLATLLILLLTHKLTPVTAAGAYTFAMFPTALLMVIQLKLDWLRPVNLKLESIKLLLSYGVRSYGIDLLGTLALQVDQVLVVNLLAPAAMGSYVVVLGLSRMLNLFQNAVVMVLFPKAAGRPLPEIMDLTVRSARLSTLVTALCGTFVCLVGPFLLKLLYGKEYVGALGALRILVTEVTISGLVFVLAQAFMAFGRPGIVTMLQAVGLSLSIPVMLWLIPKWGVLGAAVALLASTVARLVLLLLAFRFVLKQNIPNLLPHLSDFHLLGARFRRVPQPKPAEAGA